MALGLSLSQLSPPELVLTSFPALAAELVRACSYLLFPGSSSSGLLCSGSEKKLVRSDWGRGAFDSQMTWPDHSLMTGIELMEQERS